MLTDNQGRAVARGMRPNNVQGQYQIRVNASKNGQTASTTIAQSNALVAGLPRAQPLREFPRKLIAIIAVAAGAAVAGGVVAATHKAGTTTLLLRPRRRLS